MNKTHLYSLSGALLASTALSGAASAGTIGKFDGGTTFVTTATTIANTVFSTTASTANGVTIAGEEEFGINYSNRFSGQTHWTTEFTISGARFITSGLTTDNVKIMVGTASNTATGGVAGSTACASLTSLVNMLVVNDCSLSGTTNTALGIAFTGVTFNSASGLATAGGSVTLSGRVYNPDNPSQTFEESTSGTIITSAAPLSVVVTAGNVVTVDATTTPVAFSSLTTAGNSLTATLATIAVTSTGALSADLTTAITQAEIATASVSVSSSVLASSAVSAVRLDQNAVNLVNANTASAFSSGTVTFTIANMAAGSYAINVWFDGSAAIPAAAAGTVSVTGTLQQQTVAGSGATTVFQQGGFRAEVNTFNASTNGPFGSYLRIHNNNSASGAANIMVRNDATGAVLGTTFTTASIAANSTLQLSALDIETAAGIADADRTGSYTLTVTGAILGYVQHILFDGNSVADLSGYRNSGSTSGQP